MTQTSRHRWVRSWFNAVERGVVSEILVYKREVLHILLFHRRAGLKHAICVHRVQREVERHREGKKKYTVGKEIM